ncbi:MULTISPECIES: dTMP kinase [Helicobacter]|uniref:Thymidylate kinase n=2 Tax=Helicobacter typhlonius TaxID=76936 RepID=A0A099UAL9_9HELI|nr:MULTISPECIES: dTMP kinase [Helicobacter]TLD78722.1 dTMP kinase [Helicobacter typhlonius]TLD89510.1 dTMP kinase [Helicobacter sp. MIT 03-1616]CUU39991.1 Thymidylate kinase [Helicobacter typhlonius]
MYVAIEGVDTCGKSTQIELLRKYYPRAIFTKEPGGSVLGKSVRDLVLFAPQRESFTLDSYAEFFLFLADRAQHYTEVLLPHKDKLVISDRSVISSIAYARNIDMAQSIIFNEVALRGHFPHLVVLLWLEEAQLKARLAQKTHDSIEGRGIEFMLEIQNRLLESTKRVGLKHIVINAAKSREEIYEEIIRVIDDNM